MSGHQAGGGDELRMIHALEDLLEFLRRSPRWGAEIGGYPFVQPGWNGKGVHVTDVLPQKYVAHLMSDNGRQILIADTFRIKQNVGSRSASIAASPEGKLFVSAFRSAQEDLDRLNSSRWFTPEIQIARIGNSRIIQNIVHVLLGQIFLIVYCNILAGYAIESKMKRDEQVARSIGHQPDQAYP